ncbi:MAG: hypothetical protein HY841_13690, partial [Bacteroidetes bacterium]|nr:hypothetical protein [Bacteroidota bacterium]
MKKTFTHIAIAFIACCLWTAANCFSQGAWTQKADLPGVARYKAAVFSIGNKGYMGTGSQGVNYLQDLWEYNPATDSWTQKANFGGMARNNAVGFSIGSKGYIGLGFGSNTYLKDLWEYDTTLNTWTQKADLPGATAPRQSVFSFSIGTKAYIGAGVFCCPQVNYTDVWEWNQSNNTWTQKANFAGGLTRMDAIGFSINGKGYAGTGSDAGSWKDFWEYNPTTDTWTQKANFGGQSRSMAVGFSIGGRGYIGTGASGATYHQDFWEYNPATNSWIVKAPFPGTGRYDAAGFSIGNKGYIGTGYDGGTNQDFYEWNPCTIMSTTVTASPDTCTTNGAATVSATGGSSPYSYLWSTGASTSAITGLAPGTYSVLITDNVGCTTSSTANIIAYTIPAPICLVTVDTSTSTKNVIVWQKPFAGNIDSFRIYREIGLNNYVYIGGVHYDSLSWFTDTTNGVNPKITSYRYKISEVDTCGSESVLSTHHRTIHLSTPSYTPPSTFDLIWTNDYEGFSFSQYYILRDGNNTGIWTKIDSVSYGTLSYTDINAPTDSARYIVEAAPAQPCNVSIKNPDALA